VWESFLRRSDRYSKGEDKRKLGRKEASSLEDFQWGGETILEEKQETFSAPSEVEANSLG